MRIGIYDPYLDTLGGGERYMLSAAVCLAKDHTVEVFWDDKEVLQKAKQRFGIDTSALKLTKNIFSRQSKFFNKIKQTREYDALIYLSDGSLPILFAKKNFIHFQFPVEWVRFTPITWLKLKFITDIICNSTFTKKFIDEKFSIDSTVLYPPFIPIEGKKEKKNMIMTVGRYNRMENGDDFKKLAVMIHTFKELVDEGLKKWELVVITNSDEEGITQLKEKAKDYPITIENSASYDKLVEYYKSAKIYWHAAGFGENLHEHPERAEHFGISPLEAMSAGVVPVLFYGGGLPEIVTHRTNGYLWRNLDELKAATTIVSEDEKVRENISHAAIARAQEFGEIKFCAELHKIITE